LRFTVNGEQLELTADGVQRQLRLVRPEPLHQYAIQVDSMLVQHLRREGWEIVRSADTVRRERGIDIEATRGTETVAIEVKGFPGRSYADPRKAGEKENTAQHAGQRLVRPRDPGRDDRQDPTA